MIIDAVGYATNTKNARMQIIENPKKYEHLRKVFSNREMASRAFYNLPENGQNVAGEVILSIHKSLTGKELPISDLTAQLKRLNNLARGIINANRRI